jgi:hypothetical protein
LFEGHRHQGIGLVTALLKVHQSKQGV